MGHALLAIWVFATSLLGPSICCCAPSFPWKTAAVAPTAEAASPSNRCPHCQKTPKPASPSRNPAPCPSNCPFQYASAVPASPVGFGHEGRALAPSHGPPASPADFTAPAYPLVPENTFLIAAYAGPPPVAGVELLRRFHILVC